MYGLGGHPWCYARALNGGDRRSSDSQVGALKTADRFTSATAAATSSFGIRLRRTRL
jgi:hypothetical protein